PTVAPTEPTPIAPTAPTHPAVAQTQSNDVDNPLAGAHHDGGHAWWKDPIGDSLVILGLAGGGVGAALLVSASSANSSVKNATSFGDAQALQDRAHWQGQYGVIAASAGGALLVTGIIWYATHTHHAEQPVVTGWIAPSGGGIAISGGF